MAEEIGPVKVRVARALYSVIWFVHEFSIAAYTSCFHKLSIIAPKDRLKYVKISDEKVFIVVEFISKERREL